MTLADHRLSSNLLLRSITSGVGGNAGAAALGCEIAEMDFGVKMLLVMLLEKSEVCFIVSRFNAIVDNPFDCYTFVPVSCCSFEELSSRSRCHTCCHTCALAGKLTKLF